MMQIFTAAASVVDSQARGARPPRLSGSTVVEGKSLPAKIPTTVNHHRASVQRSHDRNVRGYMAYHCAFPGFHPVEP